MFGEWKFVAGEYLWCFCGDECCSVSDMNGSSEVGIDQVNLGLQWHVTKGHVIEDDGLIFLTGEAFKIVDVGDDECRFETLPNCP